MKNKKSLSRAPRDRAVVRIQDVRLLQSRGQVFRRVLQTWFHLNRREFPWRKTHDPYRVLVAEIFLRKTQAKQVSSIYRRFLREFATPQRLAESNARQLRTVVWSLGLPARVGELKKLGEMLTTQYDGRVPRNERDLMSLPGVGRYVARAVMTFAYGRRCVAVDANVIRLIGRYFGITSKKSRAREDPALWRFCDALMPTRGPRDFNWALFDFAAMVCTPRKPRCQACPLSSNCIWFKDFERSLESIEARANADKELQVPAPISRRMSRQERNCPP